MLSAPVFPPADGWCVHITDLADGRTVDERTFDLAEDAREFAKRHVSQHKDHGAQVMNREGGITVFTTSISFPRNLRA